MTLPNFLVIGAQRSLFGRSTAPPELAQPMRCRLRAYYQDDVRALEDLLGRALTAWRR